jgi:hypothetical protein
MSAYTSLARKANEHFKKSGSTTMYVPIKSVDGVRVWATLDLNRKTCGGTHISLTIATAHSVNTPDDEGYPGNISLYTSIKLKVIEHECDITPCMLETIFADVPKLKFNKMEGRLQTEPIEDMYSFLNEFENVETEYQKCCVCLDNTSTTTCCNHHLCYQCLGNIKPTRDEDIDCSIILCPICREEIAH